MNPRILIAVGLFLAVSGFGLTRWVERSMQHATFRGEGWNGPEPTPSDDAMLARPDLFKFDDDKPAGVPLSAVYLGGWGVCALGCAVTGAGLSRRSAHPGS